MFSRSGFEAARGSIQSSRRPYEKAASAAADDSSEVSSVGLATSAASPSACWPIENTCSGSSSRQSVESALRGLDDLIQELGLQEEPDNSKSGDLHQRVAKMHTADDDPDASNIETAREDDFTSSSSSSARSSPASSRKTSAASEVFSDASRKTSEALSEAPRKTSEAYSRKTSNASEDFSEASRKTSEAYSEAYSRKTSNASDAFYDTPRKTSDATEAFSRRTSTASTASTAKNVRVAPDYGNEEPEGQVDDQVDRITRQMMEAFGAEEEVKYTQTLTKKVTSFGDCAECKLPIEREASVVDERYFHPDCFTCYGCKKPLGEDNFYIIDGKNYCEKDRDAFLDQCQKCRKVIIGDVIKPRDSGDCYHPECFTCDQCDQPIQGKYYDKNGKFICQEDYKASREKCGRCSEPIMETVLKALGTSFHPNCFTCTKCPLCLDGIQFYLDEEQQPMCQTCYARHAAKRCSNCQEPIVEDCLVSKNTGGYFHKGCYKSQERVPGR